MVLDPNPVWFGLILLKLECNAAPSKMDSAPNPWLVNGHSSVGPLNMTKNDSYP